MDESYTAGFVSGKQARSALDLNRLPIEQIYAQARLEADQWRHVPIMSDALTRANRRARAFAIGYLRGFRA